MLVFILLIVILLLCFKVWNKIEHKGFQGTSLQEGFRESMKPRDEPKKKGLICYYGGAFRDGGNLSTLQDTEKGYDSQYYATQSHIKLTNVLKNRGFDVDTLINTYHSNYEKELTKWYNPFNIILNTINRTLKSTDGRDKLIQTSIRNIKNMTTDDYDFIIFPTYFIAF